MASSTNTPTTTKSAAKATAVAKPKAAGSTATQKSKAVASKGKAAKAAPVSGEDENATVTTGESSGSDGSDTSTNSKKKKVIAVADPEFDRRLKDVLAGFDEVILRVREGKQTCTDLKKAYHQQIKEINKRKKRTGTTTGNSFKIPSLVRGTKLHDFMGVPHGERLARQAVTNRIHAYAIEKGLQREDNRQCMNLDSTLEEILGTTAERRAILEQKKTHDEEVTDDVGYFNMQTFLKKWFVTKAEEDKMNANAGVVATATASA